MAGFTCESASTCYTHVSISALADFKALHMWRSLHLYARFSLSALADFKAVNMWRSLYLLYSCRCLSPGRLQAIYKWRRLHLLYSCQCLSPGRLQSCAHVKEHSLAMLVSMTLALPDFVTIRIFHFFRRSEPDS